MLAPWLDLAPIVVQLSKVSSDVTRRLAMAPPKAFHSYAAWLRSMSGADPAELVLELAKTAPKTLLGRALGHDQPQSLWRLLDRLPPVAQDLETYRSVDRISRGQFCDVLASMEEITPTELLLFHNLQVFALQEPLLVPAARAIAKSFNEESTLDIDDFLAVIQVLRALGQVTDSEAWHTQLAAQKSASGLARWLSRKMRNIPLQCVNTEGSDLRCAARIDDFMRLADVYRNCLKHSHRLMAHAIAGRALLLEHVAEPKGVVSLEVQARTQQGQLLVRVAEMRGLGNRPLGAAGHVITDKIRGLPGLIVSERGLEPLLTCVMSHDNRPAPEPEDEDFARDLEALALAME